MQKDMLKEIFRLQERFDQAVVEHRGIDFSQEVWIKKRSWPSSRNLLKSSMRSTSSGGRTRKQWIGNGSWRKSWMCCTSL